LISITCKRTGIAICVLAFLATGVLNVRAQNKQSKTDSQAQPEEQAIPEGVVVPPPPNVTKKNPQAISIPLKEQTADSKDSKYEEKPAAVHGVTVGSTFGYRRDPFTGRSKFHTGLDIKAHWGDPVGASQIGTVQFAGWSHGYGNLIIVDHGGGVTTHYAHLSSFAVEVGQSVERGTVLGYAGSTGRATSPHLHYEVRIDGSPVNPMDPIALDASSAYFALTGATGEREQPSSRSSSAAPSRRVVPVAGSSTKLSPDGAASEEVAPPKDQSKTVQPAKQDNSTASQSTGDRPRRVSVETKRTKNGDSGTL